ncbi:peroxidase [Scaptodrosophila lebanonensis]|uniref:Peroxidase n=1 Tax=Drosophila lebanonensis TaxID=7225 RepID=A0A6J2TUC6_DROLE|nr:peroxidase [Scaptodrosophila lebanonensis]
MLGGVVKGGSPPTGRCPFSPSMPDEEAEPSAKPKRNSLDYEMQSDAPSATSEYNLDSLLKNFLPKYSIKSAPEGIQHRWMNDGKAVSPVTCGVPPLNCLNDTKNLHYRRIDGACNNLVYPDFGISVSRFLRLLRPKYADATISGAPLPNARLISLSLYGEDTLVDRYRTVAAMQWGQFVAHDISMLSTQGAPKDCCADRNNKQCYPITLPRGGPISHNTGKSCLHFARSVSDADAICSKSDLAYPEKLSVVTAFMDLSSLYGSSEEQSNRVRLHKRGLLRTSYVHGQNWLPVSQNIDGECGTRNECYSIPDKRNRFTPTIAILHTLLLREHNRLAEQLALINPYFNDEQLYQEARKINIAQFQKITYYDWLPLFVGHAYAQLTGLVYSSEPTEFVNDYDESVNAGPYAEFSAAAFRYGHTQIPGWFSLVAPNRKGNRTMRLSDYFDRTESMRLISEADNYDGLLRGLATQLQKRSDASIDREVKHYFNRKEFDEFGSDLKSLDIQRARDFELPSYNDMREYCGLRRALDWNDFYGEISQAKIAQLRRLYASPEDVELSVGGSLEFHAPDALFGPTFLCIVGKQFLNTRRGDRFFFENYRSGFSRLQLAEIRKASVASLFCNNAHYLRYIQPNVFVFPNTRNILLSCDDIPRVDLSKWQVVH